MNGIILSTRSKMLSVRYEPVAIRIVSEYLKQAILPEDNEFEIEIYRFTADEHAPFNTFGAARLEILFYEKTTSGDGQENVVLYGIAENVCSQLKSFTLSFDTWWLDCCNRHPEDGYFDSIIVERSGFSRIIPGTSLELRLRDSAGILAAHCNVVLRFDSACLKRAADC